MFSLQLADSGLQAMIIVGAVVKSNTNTQSGSTHPIFGTRHLKGNSVTFEAAYPGQPHKGLMLTSSVQVGTCRGDSNQQEVLRVMWAKRVRQAMEDDLEKQEETDIAEKQVWEYIR